MSYSLSLFALLSCCSASHAVAVIMIAVFKCMKPIKGQNLGGHKVPLSKVHRTREKSSFTGVVSATLNFHPQGRNVNDVTNVGKG